MYEYQFIRVPVRYVGSTLDESPYQQAVHEQARAGWRLVQVLVEQPAAVVTEQVLIFERPAP